MSNFDKLFGRTYSTVGNSDSDFIIKTRGQVKVQWGKKFIDIIKDGKLNVDVSFIGSVDSYNDIGSKDGLYYVKEDGSIYLVVNGNKINILGDVDGTYVSFASKQDTADEQKGQASKNLGIRYSSKDEATEYGVTNGIVFLEDANRWYIVEDGVFTLYPSELESPYKKQLIISKEDNSIGALVISGQGNGNALIFNAGSDTLSIYKDFDNYSIDSSSPIITTVGTTSTAELGLDGLSLSKSLFCDSIESSSASDSTGFKLYMLDGKSILSIDQLMVRESSDIVDITYEELVTLMDSTNLSTATRYRITDFQNEWELTTEEDVIDEDEQAVDENGDPLWQDEDKTIPVIAVHKNTHPLIVSAITTSKLSGTGTFDDNREWKVEYDPYYNETLSINRYDESGNFIETVELTAKGRITRLTDEKGNSCNYDFKHLKFKITEDGVDKWIYTFRNGEEDLSLTDTCKNNVLTVNNYEIKSETVTVRDNGNIVTLQGTLSDNNFGTINSNFNFSGTANKLNVSGTLENVTFKEDSAVDEVAIRSLTNVTFNESFSRTTFHSDINDVDFDTTVYALLYDNEKVKDVYYNNNTVSVICIPDMSTATSGIPAGTIVMYNGTSGIPAGWAICDGTEGTPNLTGNFIKASETAGETGEFIPASSGSSTETPITYYSLVFIMKLA
ncbi:MAG: Tail Collar Domain [Bacteriophage sp.]|nr:MAG: Tail Collar Domain [Bacteriophage sp.]